MPFKNGVQFGTQKSIRECNNIYLQHIFALHSYITFIFHTRSYFVAEMNEFKKKEVVFMARPGDYGCSGGCYTPPGYDNRLINGGQPCSDHRSLFGANPNVKGNRQTGYYYSPTSK